MFSTRTVELVQDAFLEIIPSIKIEHKIEKKIEHKRKFKFINRKSKSKSKPRFDPKKTAEAKDDLARLNGHAPYDSWSNICYGDGHYAKSLEHKWGMSTSELAKAIKYRGRGRPFYNNWD